MFEDMQIEGPQPPAAAEVLAIPTVEGLWRMWSVGPADDTPAEGSSAYAASEGGRLIGESHTLLADLLTDGRAALGDSDDLREMLAGLPEPAWSTFAPSGLLGDMLERASLVADSAGLASAAEAAEAATPGLTGWARRHNILAEATFPVVERIGALERLKAWVDAQQVREMARLVEFCTALAPPGRELHETFQSCAAEIAAMLRLAPATAGGRLERATRLYERLPDTWAAVRAGTLSLTGADRLVSATLHCSVEEARRVEAHVLPKAGAKTPGDIQRAAARAVLRIAPEAAAKRHRKAKADRRVALYPDSDGMVHLDALVPAEAGVAMYNVLDAYARANAAKDDPRGVDARRVDALIDLVLGRRDPHAPGSRRSAGGPDGGRDVCCTNTRPTPAWGADIRAEIRVTVAATTLLGLDNNPGELAGFGPITADVARELAEDGVWQRILTDPVTGAVTDVSAKRYRPGKRWRRTSSPATRPAAFPAAGCPPESATSTTAVPIPKGAPHSATSAASAESTIFSRPTAIGASPRIPTAHWPGWRPAATATRRCRRRSGSLTTCANRLR